MEEQVNVDRIWRKLARVVTRKLHELERQPVEFKLDEQSLGAKSLAKILQRLREEGFAASADHPKPGTVRISLRLDFD